MTTFPDGANVALAVIANILSALIGIAPLPRIVHLIQTQDIETHDGFPYELLWFSSVLWTIYGVSVSLLSIAIISAMGTVAGLTYLLIWISYLPFADSTRRYLHFILLPILLALTGALAIAVLFGTDNISLENNVLGWTAAVVSILFSLSPFVSVVITGNVTSMTWLLSLAIFLSGAVWVLYGVGIDNWIIIISNSVETASGAAQLILLASCGIKDAKPHEERGWCHCCCKPSEEILYQRVHTTEVPVHNLMFMNSS
jgi:uncharacterized protein with PQ loop repeat